VAQDRVDRSTRSLLFVCQLRTIDTLVEVVVLVEKGLEQDSLISLLDFTLGYPATLCNLGDVPLGVRRDNEVDAVRVSVENEPVAAGACGLRDKDNFLAKPLSCVLGDLSLAIGEVRLLLRSQRGKGLRPRGVERINLERSGSS